FEKERIKSICAVLPFFHIFSFCTNVVFTIDKDILTIIPSISQYGIKNLMELIYEYKCTAIPLVPTVLKKMLNEPISDLVKISTLRYILAGGEPIDEASIKKLHDNLPDCVYASVYGMSENACISISRKNDTVEQITKTVGKPLSCITIEIRDNATGKVLNVGEEGVIHFKSSVMTPCYYKFPIERQPFDDRGFLDTGDIGSIDHDGYLRIVGRVKDLIIRGGENISPGEIRDEIMKYSDIALAEVVGVPNDTYGEEVDAAIVLKSGSTFNEDKLRTALLKKLSKYKVPEHFIVYDSLPKLTNGKVDKVKLKNDMKKRIYNI
ncbi:MAG: acyl--CoA ligase, partial [Lachnospiraceae bacterium]|nr:acyl--CoA ligase [Lachnospiraceae bacterium]